MKALVSSDWLSVGGCVLSLLVLWAVFVVPGAPGWAGYLAAAMAAMTTAAVVLKLATTHESADLRQVLADVEREPATVPVPVVAPSAARR